MEFVLSISQKRMNSGDRLGPYIAADDTKSYNAFSKIQTERANAIFKKKCGTPSMFHTDALSDRSLRKSLNSLSFVIRFIMHLLYFFLRFRCSFSV